MKARDMIHPTAIIEEGAQLGKNVRVGPHCYIGPHVVLGDGCELKNSVTLVGRTTVGPDCLFFTNCVIGEIPQDLKFKGGETELTIGEDNHFRESVTVHAGTELGGGVTRIGNHNRFLVGVHLAHDARIGNHVVMSNNVQIAGHVHIEDFVTMGGMAGVHHFATVGRNAMLGGLSRVITDAPPYMVSKGYDSTVRGVNVESMKRCGLSPDDIEAVSRAYKMLYAKSSNREAPFIQRLEELRSRNGHNTHVQYLCQFIERTLAVGKRGRYLESLRSDTPADSRAHFEKKPAGDS
ncbi:MAG: acyl-ACP--UDP-N-acetylglucosamine O-acyltransferase [Planctomycetes bacterium]|nr:acyl-ACP--UDP-N-acetylglucosamine O-acyltransferase [Planctomycetota bacterium]